MTSTVARNERLIECVREHVVLYDTDMKEYSDFQLKLKVWNEIAHKCRFSSGGEAKNAWKNLRDGYRCALKKQTGDSGKKSKPWKFLKQMDFLRPHMQDRPRTTDLSYEYESEMLVDGDDEKREVQTRGSFFGEDFRPNVKIEETSAETVRRPGDVATAHKATKRWQVREEAGVVQTSKKTRSGGGEDEHQQVEFLREDASLNQDSLKLFFESMYVATRQLPTQLQRRVRQKIFEVVSDAEDCAETYVPQKPTETLYTVGSGSSYKL